LTLNHPIVPLNDIIKRVEALEKARRGQVPVVRQQPPAAAVRQQSQSAAVKEQPPQAPETGLPPAANAVSASGLSEVLSSWTAIVNHIMPKKISVASYLQEGYPVYMEGNTLSIGFPKSLQFHKEVLESQDNKGLIEAAIKAVLGKDIKVALTLSEFENSSRSRNGSSDEESPEDFSEADEARRKEVDPIVKTAMEIFGGDIAESGSGKGRGR
jgi:hypothetical protein